MQRLAKLIRGETVRLIEGRIIKIKLRESESLMFWVLVQFALRSFATLCETFAAFAVKSKQDRKVREVKTQSYAKRVMGASDALPNGRATAPIART